MPAPGRIVSLLSSATEMLFALGVGKRVVGIGHECDWPPAATDRPRVTRAYIDSSQPSDEIDRQVRERMANGEALYGIDAELLAALAPDLIVTQAQCDVCAIRYADVVELVNALPALESTQIVALAPQSLADILADIERVGDAVGAPDAAARFVAQLRARLTAVQQPCAQARKPRVICIEWVEPLMLAANWTPTLIELAGGQAGLVQANEHSTYADWNDVVAYDPEVIVIAPCGFDLARSLVEAARLASLPGWGKLSAVRERRVFVLDGNAYLNRSGPRIVDSVEWLARMIHPELFAPPSKCREIYRTL